MNKYSLITAVAIVVIVLPILYGVWGIFSVQQLELRTPNDEFSYFDMSNYEQIAVCNSMPFFVTFNKIQILTYYQNDLKGFFEMGPTTLNPNSLEILDMDFSSESFAESQYMYMHMDGQFDGEVPIRLDPNQMIVQINYETNVIGFIPYQNMITISAFEFTQMMNEESSCKTLD